MYDLTTYGRMIADEGRFSAYRRALEVRVTPGSVVLDIGTGPGILSFVACRAGASKVYAIEPDDVIEVAREAAATNGFSDRIQFIRAMSTAIDLPEKVDGIVADLRGVLPMFGSGIASILDARTRFLKPEGWVVAARDTLWTAVVCSPQRHDGIIKGWDTGHEFDFSGARGKVLNAWRRAEFTPDEILLQPRCWATIDYHALTSPHVTGDATWAVEHDAMAHGVAVWFDTETAPGIGFSNSPLAHSTHLYRQGFFPWPQATQIQAGSEIRVSVRANFVHDDYVWSWDTHITGPGSSGVTAHYQQSTFHAPSISSGRLRKRAHDFIATPNGAATIDRRILEMMDGRIALSGIADALLKEFPSHFSNWDEALTRAGDISDRYSE